MNSFFNNTIDKIDDILSKRTTRTYSDFSKDIISKSIALENLNESQNSPTKYENNKTLINYDTNFVIENFGLNEYAFNVHSIGSHPDFQDLNHSNYINHHCVSMFVDIKGSTKLIDKYSILEVRLIKDTIITLIINVINQFGGHVQRLQGDGVFVLFARRNKSHFNSIINALNSATLITQFISVDLADIFNKNDIHPLRIRVGIDYGEEKDVIWSYYGLPGCDELTTTSLHTDMAAKLQSKASDNNILIGNNIVSNLDLTREYISNYYNKDGIREEVYEIAPSLTYKFYIFEWKNYLSKHPNFKLLSNQKLKYEKPKLYLKCSYKIDNGDLVSYYPNSKGIPKDAEIFFTLFENSNIYIKKGFEKIKWTIYNTGNEAKLDNCIEQEVQNESNNKIDCTVNAKYLGFHKIQCKLIREHLENVNIEFPVIVY